MNRYILLITLFVLSGCTSQLNTVYSYNDTVRGEQSHRLEQKIDAYRSDQNLLFGKETFGKIRARYFGRMKGKEKLVSIDLLLDTQLSYYYPESTLYIVADGKTFEVEMSERIVKQYNQSSSSVSTTTNSTTKEDGESSKTTVSVNNTTTQDQSSRELITLSFPLTNDVVESLSVANSITYRIYIGNRPIDIQPDVWQRKKIRLFFSKVFY